jgi:putative ABC transport system permease protein
MFNNYLRIAVRNQWKNRGLAAINIIGLATVIGTCLLIFLYVFDEFSFDKFNLNADRIYRIGHDVKWGGNHFDLAQAPAALGPEALREFPQVDQYVRFSWHQPIVIKKGDENLSETKVTYVDSTLFDVFTLPMIAGNPKTALTEPHSIVITEAMAYKYFNRSNPLGEIMILNDNQRYRISGIMKNLPEESHFHFQFFLPMCENEDSRNGDNGWISENYNTYFLLRKDADARRLLPELDKMLDRHVVSILRNTMGTSAEQFKKDGSFVHNTLMPLAAIHLHSDKLGELDANGNITYVHAFSAAAVFLLLIACSNFMNLSTARSSNRAREVGVRKVLGSLRHHLIGQFLAESFALTFIAVLLGLLMAVLLLPWFNNLTSKQLNVSLLFQPVMLTALIVLMLVAGLLGGTYPALYLSAFNPIEVLKGKHARGFKNVWLRNSLVVFQFTSSIILIAATLIVYNQLSYIRSKDIGFNRDNVLIIQHTNTLKEQATMFADELRTIPGISNATITGYLPVNGDRSSSGFSPSPIMDPKMALIMQRWTVDENYLPTLGIQLVKGRNFLKDFASDSNAIIINEAAAKLLAADNPVNTKLYTWKGLDAKEIVTHTIVGVVKNFNFNSLRDMITPLALRFGRNKNSIAVRINSKDIAGTLALIKTKWHEINTLNPFIYSFIDEEFENQYRVEQQIGKISITFAILAVLIASLGLFGLVTYAAEQRVKEIGIRKVLGASMANILVMVSKDFLKLVLIASAIAFPLAWYVMHVWLQDFAYRVNISWWVFFAPGIISLFIAICTVAFQALKASLANPAITLRSE